MQTYYVMHCTFVISSVTSRAFEEQGLGLSRRQLYGLIESKRNMVDFVEDWP